MQFQSTPPHDRHPEPLYSPRRVTSRNEPIRYRPLKKKKLVAPSIASFAMGGIRPGPSRMSIRSSLTRPVELRPEMNPSGIAPSKKEAGCPIHRVFCDGWDTTRPISPVHQEQPDSPRRVTSRNEPIRYRPLKKRSWVPHPSRLLRWVGYDQAHLAPPSGAHPVGVEGSPVAFPHEHNRAKSILG